MKPEPKVFTRDNPCTKLHIWNAFKGKRGWKRVQVDEAHAVIGLNAPKHMLNKGYVERRNGVQKDYYALTTDGVTWLQEKFRSHLARHPEDRKKALNVPKHFLQ